MSKRSLMLANSLFRVSYGVGALFVPSKMAALKLAADTAEHPEARLFVRGFGSHQIAVAAVGLASRRWRRLEQPAAVAAIAIDAFDMLSALVEARGRGQVTPTYPGAWCSRQRAWLPRWPLYGHQHRDERLTDLRVAVHGLSTRFWASGSSLDSTRHSTPEHSIRL
ncbi:MAG TPA: hypothetical protein VK672_08770 [Solirubrobacteraceae bacterium]|nr:hypothetical protein [Solirubrobacteraceae bacterium]